METMGKNRSNRDFTCCSFWNECLMMLVCPASARTAWGRTVWFPTGEQLVFGNADLLSSRIRNYKRMTDRRVILAFGVVYATPPQQLELVNSIVRRAIEQQTNVRFDRCHFCKFGDSSLEFEAVYYINSPDYNIHMDTQQSVLLSMARAFADDNIDFAFPTQTLYLSRVRDGLPVNGPARSAHHS